ncbi:MAG: pectin lyase fold/virulence factor protein [Devosia sp.]|nr:pectin lyase fold/virulence factor protein [Devosia sp.]
MASIELDKISRGHGGPSANVYSVTEWPAGNPHEDIGAVINSIIADIKRRQAMPDVNDGGKPGAVIYIPPGDFRLRTQVVIDISFLRIVGSGHGFTSSSIRFNTPRRELEQWHEIWPGGSRILVDLAGPAGDGAAGAAFLVQRAGNPRISSVEFADFCIDGLHFTDASNGDAENSYRNGKTGIHIASANDSFRITGMGLVYLEHGLVSHHADASTIDNNFIAECGSWRRLCRALDLRRKLRRPAGLRQQRVPARAEQHRVLGRSQVVHYRQPAALLLSGNAGLLRQVLGEPRRLKSLPSRSRTLGADDAV